MYINLGLDLDLEVGKVVGLLLLRGFRAEAQLRQV